MHQVSMYYMTTGHFHGQPEHWVLIHADLAGISRYPLLLLGPPAGRSCGVSVSIGAGGGSSTPKLSPPVFNIAVTQSEFGKSICQILLFWLHLKHLGYAFL
jgi:hypothetical protein